tara:strand:- start:753 stop:1646 length:894 start_codon:yes stop_codon:yes gene_type:complete
MNKKARIDFFGACALILFSVLLAINHVVIKVVNTGLNPIFFAGARSVIAFFALIIWMKISRKPIVFNINLAFISCLAGLVFSLEFLFLFLALDFTTVSRNSIIFYSMPVWLAILAHFFVPDERLNIMKIFGLICAFTGVTLSLLINVTDFSFTNNILLGDFFAILAAFTWALLILLAKGTKFSQVSPEMQLIWMVMISGPVLILLSLIFGNPIRDFELIHFWGLIFQSVIVVAGGFLFWLWLLSVYPASGVASFSFLTPIFTIFFGWLILDDALNIIFLMAAFMVVLGLIFINKTNH